MSEPVVAPGDLQSAALGVARSRFLFEVWRLYPTALRSLIDLLKKDRTTGPDDEVVLGWAVQFDLDAIWARHQAWYHAQLKLSSPDTWGKCVRGEILVLLPQERTQVFPLPDASHKLSAYLVDVNRIAKRLYRERTAKAVIAGTLELGGAKDTHFQWLAHYQVGRLSFHRIWLMTPAARSTIPAAIRSLAEKLRLPLRPAQRGRSKTRQSRAKK